MSLPPGLIELIGVARIPVSCLGMMTHSSAYVALIGPTSPESAETQETSTAPTTDVSMGCRAYHA